MNRLFRLKMFFKRRKLELTDELITGLKAFIRKNRVPEPRENSVHYRLVSHSDIENKLKEAAAAKPSKGTAPDKGATSVENRAAVESRTFYQGPPPKHKETKAKDAATPEKGGLSAASKAPTRSTTFYQEACPERKETEVKNSPAPAKDIPSTENKASEEPLTLYQEACRARQETSAPADYAGGAGSSIDIDDLPSNGKEIGEMISKHLRPSFAQTLMAHIDAIGEKDSAIYRRAQIDRRVFSKIRSNSGYHPGRDTVLALALALKLNKSDTDELLASAGYALSRSWTGDLIITFCIEREIFDLDDVNILLDYFGERTLTA